MSILDMINLGLTNLKQRKLRTFLTTLGVIVGIGALSSMVSFGTGLQKNITDSFSENDLFTSLRVTTKKIDLDNPSNLLDSLTPISDSILHQLNEIEELSLVFPDLFFPGRIVLFDKEWTTTISGMPFGMGEYRPFSELIGGEFFENDTLPATIIGRQTLKFLGILIKEDKNTQEIIEQNPDHDFKIIPTDSIVGAKMKIKTVILDPSALNIATLMMQAENLPLKDTITEVTITGILDVNTNFTGNLIRGGVILPFEFANSIPRININSTTDYLNRNDKNRSYRSIYARAEDIANLEKAKKKIKKMGLEVFTMGEKLAEFRRSFLIVDAILGAIGLIALFVASLGIVNTMVMSILERTREIGIMKSIGASNKEIKLIFFVEASVIGFSGGVFGLILGWLVTRLANLVMNSQLKPLGEEPVDLFYFPAWLIIGSLVFSILISLLAGLYPATRASKIDPVKALRHD
jgi:ABC-type antimicrobial peptide transport system permease subunit